MKHLLILTLLIVILKSSFGQTASNDYKLTLAFWPSFMSASGLTIQTKGDSGFVNICVYQEYQPKRIWFESKAVISANKITALTNFLKTYKFQSGRKFDTVGSRKEFIHGDSVLVYNVLTAGSDGIDVNGLLNQGNIERKIAFWSPDKGTENAQFIALLFHLADSVLTDKEIVNYLEQLQQYFPHHLGLKKLSTDPLTYKLFGDISSDDEDELESFLKHLPPHKKVIIDMSNYLHMVDMVYDLFNKYCARNRNIYWLNPSSQGLIDLYKIGIPIKQVIPWNDN